MAATNVIFDPTGQARSLLGNYKHVGLQAPATGEIVTTWAEVVSAFATIEQTGGGIYIPDWVSAEIDQGLQFTRSVTNPVILSAIGPGRPVLKMTDTFAFLSQASYGENYPVNNLTLRQIHVRGSGSYGSHFCRLGKGANRLLEDCVVQNCMHGYTDPTVYRSSNYVIRRNLFLDTSYCIWVGVDGLEISDNTFLRSPFEHLVRIKYCVRGNITRNTFLWPENDPEITGRGHCLTLRCSPEYGNETGDVYITANVFGGGDWPLQVGYIDFLSKNVNPAYWRGAVTVAHNQFVNLDDESECFVAHNDVPLVARCNTGTTGAVSAWRYVYNESGQPVAA